MLTDGGEFGAHVDDHDGRHGQRQDVHEVGRGLEDDGVGQLDAAGVACRFDARGARQRRHGAHEGAQRQRRALADPVKVAEAHCCRRSGAGSSSEILKSIRGAGGCRKRGPLLGIARECCERFEPAMRKAIQWPSEKPLVKRQTDFHRVLVA